ncbi:Replication factor A protein 1 [Folsomia candida]|uniref:Replication factor A protein 1 n=2 Tax=Folsomia candida TaxID=158441 RepID=A0A226DCZ5_FOLCA|nr:Replication factor A protein 1 [Folsomia candida]
MDTSGSQPSGGEFGTPKTNSPESRPTPSSSMKRKLDFNFWSITSEKTQKFEKLNIVDIKQGKGLKNTIFFRVTFKSLKIVGKNGYQMFKFNALDESGEIAVLGYADATGKWFDIIKFNKAFSLEHFDAKEVNPNYRNSTSHECEIVLNNSSIITELNEDENPQPAIPFNFLNIEEVLKKADKSPIDTLGILVNVWGLETVKDTVKRDLALTDQTKQSIVVTLWGKQAEEFEEKIFTVIAIRNGYPLSFMGSCTLNIFSGSLLWAKADLYEAEELKQWFNENKPE